MNIRVMNENKGVKIASNIALLMSLLILLFDHLRYLHTALNLDNPLIPKDLIFYANKSYILGGIFLILGIIGLSIFRILKLNLIGLISIILFIIIYLLTTNGLFN
jgi:hypothetical protein